MKITKYEAPFNAEKMLNRLAEIFGEDERALEAPQLLGKETENNLDVVLLAEDESGALLGAIHATIPKREPKIAALSAMFTVKEARGAGLGRILFGKIVEEIDALGVKISFLGTSNIVAEKLYASCGYRYLYGTGVMIRTKEGGPCDFFRERYGKTPEKITAAELTPSMRIPIIPLISSRLDFLVYDANTGLANPSFLTEPSCMGLYPKYSSLKERGGDAFFALDERGVLGAIASALKTESGEYSFDFFSAPTFMNAAPLLLERIERFARENGKANLIAKVAKGDAFKEELIKSLGFSKDGETEIMLGGVYMKAETYRKSC
jgi:GNAT superfamily N-acetyltransferase